VRKLAKLAIFYSLSFLILVLVAGGIRFLALRLEWIRVFSQQPETVLAELIAAFRWALSFGLFGSILLGLNYIARKTVNAPLGVLCIFVLSLGFTSGLCLGFHNWENVPAERNTTQPLGSPGLILFNPQRPTGTAFVLLEGPEKPEGARIASVPGKPMQYQQKYSGKDLTFSGLPTSSFEINTPWLMKSLAIDLKLNAEQLRQHVNDGILQFLIYAGALIFLLCSFLFIQKTSAWPLANLFLGCLVFRGVLALEFFFNSQDMQVFFDFYLNNLIPVSYAVPAIFTIFGLLTSLYTFLVYLAKRQKDHGN
jgi:hypothetical protein